MAISVRLLNVFKNNGIENIDDLTENNVIKIFRSRNVGKKTRQEISYNILDRKEAISLIGNNRTLTKSFKRLKDDLIKLNEYQIKVTSEINNIVKYLEIE